MNNEQFRRLLLKTQEKSNNGGNEPSAKPTNKPDTLLGSRQRSSIPMTPRSIKGGPSLGADFARQLAERNGSSQQSRKFRSAAPKGSKLATGYQDRTQDRQDEDDDDKGRRIKALEESMKLGQIDRETFERIRDELTGGDIKNTHLVKGLDRKLLERIRRGEDVYSEPQKKDGDESGAVDLDDEFEQLEKQEVKVPQKDETEKKGSVATPARVAGVKRTRDQILAELKASRAKAPAPEQALQLGSKFRKIGDTLDKHGEGRAAVPATSKSSKKKHKSAKGDLLPMPDKDATPLGIDVAVPEVVPVPAEESDDDIYAGLGTEYDPLAAIGEDDDSDDESSSEDEDGELGNTPRSEGSPPPQPCSDTYAAGAIDIGKETQQTSKLPRNYFDDDPSAFSVLSKSTQAIDDPAVLAALSRRAAKEEASGKLADDDDEQARLKRRAAMLSAQDRDLEDMDMGFGSSRFDDAEDMAMEDSKVKLAEWKGTGADGDGGESQRGERAAKNRKRGPKKKKGDKNNAADVLRVMEQSRR